jgi:hypothetical protein
MESDVKRRHRKKSESGNIYKEQKGKKGEQQNF